MADHPNPQPAADGAHVAGGPQPILDTLFDDFGPQTFAITTNGTLVLRVMEPKRPGNHRVRVNAKALCVMINHTLPVVAEELTATPSQPLPTQLELTARRADGSEQQSVLEMDKLTRDGICLSDKMMADVLTWLDAQPGSYLVLQLDPTRSCAQRLAASVCRATGEFVLDRARFGEALGPRQPLTGLGAAQQRFDTLLRMCKDRQDGKRAADLQPQPAGEMSGKRQRNVQTWKVRCGAILDALMEDKEVESWFGTQMTSIHNQLLAGQRLAVDDCHYSCPQEVYADVRQVFDQVSLNYLPGSEVYALGERTWRMFGTLWAKESQHWAQAGAEPPAAEPAGAAAAAAAELERQQQEAAALAARIAEEERREREMAEAAAAGALEQAAPPQAVAAVQGVDGTDRQAVFRALRPILKSAGVPAVDIVAFLQRCIRHNSDLELVADHWQVLSEAHQAGDTETIRAWVAEELKAMS